jgi:hypothetical protein
VAQLRNGQRIQWRSNGRLVDGVYWGTDNGEHCAKLRPSDWVLHYLNADSIMVPA